MQDFSGRLAVITGGGTGMGRELACLLTAQGCHVALCDLSEENMLQTKMLCERDASERTRVSVFVADVSEPTSVRAFREEVARVHETDHVHLLFNNAGIAGGGSFVLEDRDVWDKTFAVCWGGVYECTRVFLPMLLAAPEGHVVNTSSVNGFWASLGPTTSHTAYSSAKFAVKGFTEALINDFRLNAPHLSASVVMPGHIGTSIAINSAAFFGSSPKDLSDDELEEAGSRLRKMGLVSEDASNEDVRQILQGLAEAFRDAAPTTARDAAETILAGVREKRWRILVGQDAEVLDRLVRADPEIAYEEAFMDRLRAEVPWMLGS